MIIDSIRNAGAYTALHQGFAAAFSFLERPDLATLAPGKVAIEGDRVFAIMANGPGRRRGDGLLEVHERYIDIQYVLEGFEEMGWKPAADCRQPDGPFDRDKDIRFYRDAPDAWVSVSPGKFALFFPADAHLPLVSEGAIRKVIIKIAVAG